MLIVALLMRFVFYNYSLLIMPVTSQPASYAPSEFQTGLYDCFADCGTCKDCFVIWNCDLEDLKYIFEFILQ